MADIEKGTSSSTKRAANSTAAEKTTKTLHYKSKSSNDLSLPCFNPILQAGSNSVQMLQIVILAIIIDQNLQEAHPFSAELGVGRFFVQIYLCSICIDQFGQFTRLQMRLSHARHEENAEKLVMSEEKESDSLGIGLLFVFICKILLAVVVSAWYLFKFYIKETFVPHYDVLMDKKITCLQRYLRWCGVNLEFVVMILTMIATVLVVVQQPTIMDILFNFSGIYIVLDFDEIVMNVFPKYKITVTVPKNFDEEADVNIIEPSAELGTVYYYGLILILAWASV